MVLVHSLVLLGMQNNFDLCLQHMPGVNSGIAEPSLGLTMMNCDGLHQIQTSTWHLQSHLHTNNNTHWASTANVIKGEDPYGHMFTPQLELYWLL